MQTICFYHDLCLDGIAAAWVVKKAYPDTLFAAMGNERKDPKLALNAMLPDWMEGELRLIIVDYSFNRNTLIWLHRNVTELIVLDHHVSAERELAGLDFCWFDVNESGATMAHNHFFEDSEPSPFLRYVRDGDLWLFREPYAQEIRAYMQSWPYSFESCDHLDYVLSSPHDFIMQAKMSGEAIMRYRKTLVGIMTRDICIAQIGGFDVPVVNASCLASDVTHKLCQDWPQYPFSASYVDNTKEAKRLWRLTSIGEFDVSEIAKIYGGGGHRNAAGFTQMLSMEQVETNN